MKNCNIAQAFEESVALYPERTALVVPGRSGSKAVRWKFSELGRAVDGFAHLLTEKGVGPHDRVMLMVKPSLEFIALTFAFFKLGAVVILIDPDMGFRNLRRCIAQVAPTVFVGIPKAHLFKTLFPAPFATVRISICVGGSWGLFGPSLDSTRLSLAGEPFPAAIRGEDDLAAILFTTGSTGPPKGVRYEHGIFNAQLGMIRDHYRIGPSDTDQPAFPLFGLFSIALGAMVVVPDMDPTRPAEVDPARFVETIQEHGVTYSFGSPALWNVVSRYCQERKVRLDTVTKILMAGAPVPGELIERVMAIMGAGGEVHTPYGATECLPIVSMEGREILEQTWEQSRAGSGTCVGRPLPGIDLAVIAVSDGPLAEWDERYRLPVGEIGEIAVKGPVVTRAYDNNERENRLAKISDGAAKTFWHRIGDMGYLDREGRLWFCGRKAHRVLTPSGTMYSVCCEAIFNEHPAVFRSALVGIGPAGGQKPVLIVELHRGASAHPGLGGELRALALAHPHTRMIEDFRVHPSFPVDIRHNAKIFREKLAVWAQSGKRRLAL